MHGRILSKSYRKALKLAIVCDADLLKKSLLTPPIAAQTTTPAPPIPLTTSIRELVRGGFRTPLPSPSTAKQKRSGSSAEINTLPSDTTSAAFFAIRWLQQAVTLGSELERHIPNQNPANDSKSKSHQPSYPPLMIETITLPPIVPNSLSPCSVLYSHPSMFGDELYRGMFVSLGPLGWGPSDKTQKKPAKNNKVTYPIIQLNHRTESFARELFDSMPQLAMGRSVLGLPSADTLDHATASSRGHRNVLGRLPVFLGGSHAAPSGPFVVHCNHTVAYLLAARKGPLSSSTAVARPFYVSPLSEVMGLPLKVVCTLTPNNSRVVVNQYNDKSDLGTGVFLHESRGQSVPVALLGPAAALMIPATAAAVASGRIPAPILPPGHSEWAAGLRACGLHALADSAVLTATQRATIRDGRLEIWATSVPIPNVGKTHQKAKIKRLARPMATSKTQQRLRAE